MHVEGQFGPKKTPWGGIVLGVELCHEGHLHGDLKKTPWGGIVPGSSFFNAAVPLF